ncbi:MAG: threonine--tRNA ligase [Candidatus Bathyarchaeia archaeon]
MQIKDLSDTDHRVLGQRLDMFSINEDVGVGLVLWHPKGTTVRRIIRNFWEEEHIKGGYELVCTPHIARGELWKISGHLDYYMENMYTFEKEGELYVVKPMNCPFPIQIYKAKPRSYKELPIKYAEWGTVYRYERSGTLHGLLRVRGLTQDDAHIFCTPEQMEDEILKLLDFTEHILKRFGFHKYEVVLSTRDESQPEKYMGSDEDWSQAQKALAKALKRKGLRYREMPGEAVFYGPKIDLYIEDASGRKWQCSTIQFDFNLPKRFNVTYVGPDGKKHGAIMIHRALLGTIERFFALLLEHFKGNLPLWLSPVQVRILPMGDKYLSYAKKIHEKLESNGVRSEIEESQSTINYKIREAEVQKIPYMIILGKRELKAKKVSVRRHGFGHIGMMTLKQFITKIESEERNIHC